MKKEDITYQEKLNELRLDLRHPKNKGTVFIFLEGEYDVRLFRKLFNLEKCKVESIPGGKTKLEECVKVLNNELNPINPLVIGIRDADFLHLENTPYSKKNIFLTDYHDMEMLLIAEDEIFSSVLCEFTPLTREQHPDIRKTILAMLEEISLLKWLNEKENLKYKFDAGFQDLIDFKQSKIDLKEYISRVHGKLPDAKLKDFSIIKKKLATLKQIGPDLFQVCNGHDFMVVLCRYIHQTGGKALKDENIGSNFRIAYRLDHFQKTELFKKLKSWADSNNSIIFFSDIKN